MYIVNPFRRKFSADQLTSTHPPISERVRILRAMAGNAAFVEYDRAFQKVKGKSVLPPSALTGGPLVGLRAPAPPEAAAASHVERVRETTDILWRLNDYLTITCACGTKLKLPPAYDDPRIKCPHCGRVNSVTRKHTPAG
jgi:heat shock protein HtpX